MAQTAVPLRPSSCRGMSISEGFTTSRRPVPVISKTAISEVEGVAGLANTAGGELAELLGLKTVTKGVKVQLDDNKVVVDAIITVTYGYSIVKVAQEVQEKIINVIQATTGFDKPQVNVHVSGLAFDK